jgi:hypothetical protein
MSAVCENDCQSRKHADGNRKDKKACGRLKKQALILNLIAKGRFL